LSAFGTMFLWSLHPAPKLAEWQRSAFELVWSALQPPAGSSHQVRKGGALAPPPQSPQIISKFRGPRSPAGGTARAAKGRRERSRSFGGAKAPPFPLSPIKRKESNGAGTGPGPTKPKSRPKEVRP
jgi:hypothetical protein